MRAVDVAAARTTRESSAAAPALVRAVADRFLAALVGGDDDGLADLLAPDVWLRALLTREALGPHGVDGRARIRYRVRLRPVWAPDTWHVIEQTGYLKVGTDGRVARLDLSCTCYHPV